MLYLVSWVALRLDFTAEDEESAEILEWEKECSRPRPIRHARRVRARKAGA
jgi:hypothetical protein